jgi:hypothetical protein
MRARFVACLVALVAIPAACGGRLISTETDGDAGGSSSHGGSHTSGATANNGATTTTGATGSYGASSSQGGTAAYAGTPGFAGTASGGFIGIGGTTPACPPCPLIACPGGFVQVTNPDGCCYHCECNPMLCPGIGCASGSHLETRPGECCPGCVPDQEPDQCRKQQAAYQDFKKQAVEKYSSFGCMTSKDCTIYYEKNQCAAGCGIVMPVAGVNYLETGLQSFAQQNCSPKCPFPPQPPCDAPAGPFCFNGRCQ